MWAMTVLTEEDNVKINVLSSFTLSEILSFPVASVWAPGSTPEEEEDEEEDDEEGSGSERRIGIW